MILKLKIFLDFVEALPQIFFFSLLGLIALLIPFSLIISGLNIIINKKIFLILESIFYTILYSLLGSLFFSFFYPIAFKLYINGNGGFVGKYLGNNFFKFYD